MSFITAFATAKIVAGLVAGGTLAAGGTVAAAYTGNLPAPLQQTAHDVIGAPAAPHPSKAADPNGTGDAKDKGSKPTTTPKPHPSGSPVGPDATGPAAFGLCTAFTNGGLDSSSTAYKSLAAAAAAKGNADIASYCKSVPAPGKSGRPKPHNQGKSDEKKPDNPGKSDEKKPEGDSGNSATPQPTPPAQSNRGPGHEPATAEDS